jgi:anion-transporting  ArsA/GET3 family ATPase
MRIRIFVGTGGVGKTSVAAASAMRSAIAGNKCLVLTIDPARRLRTALGIDSVAQPPASSSPDAGSGDAKAILEQRIPLDEFGGQGELWAALLDVAATLNRAVLTYAQPEQAKIVLAHPIYHVLLESLAGMQELMAVERLDQAIADGFQETFIDTAPSRHAFEFVDKPEFFAELVSFPLVRLVGRTYHWWERSGLARVGRKSFELYTRVEEILGAALVRQILEFFSVFRTIAEGYAKRARRTLNLLHDPQTTSMIIVTTPFKARRDGEYFYQEMTQRKFPLGALVVNRVWPHLDLPLPDSSPAALRETVAWYQNVSQAHERMWDEASRNFSGRIPKLIQLPELSRDIDGLAALRQISEIIDV